MSETPVPPVQPEPEDDTPQMPGSEEAVEETSSTPNPVMPSVRTLEGLEHLAMQFLLAEATRLAADGKYAEAEERLAAIPDGRKHAPVLDLLARIRAQQGRPAEAVELWQMAVQMDPSNAEYRAGLAYVEKAAKGLFHPSKLPGLILRLLAGALALGLLIAILVRQGGLERRLVEQGPAATPAASQPVDMSGITSRLDSMESGLAGVESSLADAQSGLGELKTGQEDNQAALAEARQALESKLASLESSQQTLLEEQLLETAPLALNLDVAGLKVSAAGENWILTPEAGLFRYGWLLSDEARPLLEELARQLAPWQGQAQVDLIGYAAEGEQDPAFNLGMIRAVLVSDVLTNAGLPAEMIRVLPSAGRPAPFASDTLEGQAANRTVIIIIHR